VDEIAAMVAYLAGPEAGFVTGASLTVAGGFNAKEKRPEELMEILRGAEIQGG